MKIERELESRFCKNNKNNQYKNKDKKERKGKEKIQYMDIYTIMNRKAKVETIVKNVTYQHHSLTLLIPIAVLPFCRIN